MSDQFNEVAAAEVSTEVVADPQTDLLGAPVDTGNEGGFSLEDMPEIGFLPRAPYRVVCKEIEAKVSGGGNEMFVLDFEVLSPDIMEVGTGADAKKYTTAGTKFRAWFVFNQSAMFKPSVIGLARGFGIPARKYRNLADLVAQIKGFMTENAVGTTFLWNLYSEPQFKREALTDDEIANGKKYEDAPFLLDENGQKIPSMAKVQASWTEIRGSSERIKVG